jgi:ribokinase
VIVFGQIAGDLVLVVDAMPGARQSADVYQRRELLGGKGANQAVALAQLGMRPVLAGVVGEDQIAKRLLTQAQHDQVDTSAVIRRPGVRTALAAAVCAHQAGCKVVLDGAPPEKHRAALLAAADVLRADARETDLLAGFAVSTATVGHPGGRPSLTPKAVQDQLTLLAESTA